MHNRIDHGEVISEKSHTKRPVPSAAACSFQLHMKKCNPKLSGFQRLPAFLMIELDKEVTTPKKTYQGSLEEAKLRTNQDIVPVHNVIMSGACFALQTIPRVLTLLF